MSLADHFDECADCGGYVLTGTYRLVGRTLSSRCKCDELTEQVERDLRFTVELERRVVAIASHRSGVLRTEPEEVSALRAPAAIARRKA